MKNILLILCISILLVGCGSTKGSTKFEDNADTAMSYRQGNGANYDEVPEVLTDDIVSDAYGIDFYSASTVDLVEFFEVSSDNVFSDVSSDTSMNYSLVKYSTEWFQNENIDMSNACLMGCSNWGPNAHYIDISVNSKRYRCVIAVTEDCVVGQAKFTVQISGS